MSSENNKILLCVSGGGWWDQNNDGGWVYSTHLATRRVWVSITRTYSRMVKYVCLKFGMEPSDGVTRLAYTESGNVYGVSSDEDLADFLQSAAGKEPPATLYVYEDTTAELNVEDNSNIGDDVTAGYVPHFEYENQHVYDHTSFDNADTLSNNTYGVSSYNTYGGVSSYNTSSSYVSETQQPPEEPEAEDEDGEEDGEENEDEDGDMDPDNYVYDIPNFDPNEARSFPGNDDFHDLPPPPRSDDPVITPNQAIRYMKHGKVKLHQVFRTKSELTLALGLKFLQEGFEFRTPRSCKKRYEAVCMHANCGWRIYASSIAVSTMFQVRTMNDVHTCSRTQMHPAHRQATRRVLSHLLLDKTDEVRRNLKAADIMTDMKAQHKISVSYWQAWRAKWHAITMIEGDPEESFTRLPQYFYNLELNNPGTQTRIVVGNDGRFVSCFYALGCSIHTFRSGFLRKVLIIDGSHLKGHYSGTMFLAVAMDANNQVVPIAIGVAKSESGEHWTWFLSMLRECIGEMEGLVFMSDRAGSIQQAINTVYPNAHHALCCYHLYMNIKSKASNIEDNKTLFWKACKAYTEEEFELRMIALRAAVPYAELLDRVGANRWSRAHFPGKRYNIMSSNNVESMNAHANVACKHPIVGLMDYFRSYQQQWYSTRRIIAGAMTNTLAENAELIVQRRMGKCNGWTAHEIGYGEFEVRDGYRDARVHIQNMTCTCKRWQLFGLPCGHAITVAAHLGWSDCGQLASPYFSAYNLRQTYASTIYPVGPFETWVTPDYPPLMVVRPPVMKKHVGRWSDNKCIPSRGEGSIRIRCGICRQYGHNRSQCIHVLSGTRQTPVAQTQQPEESDSRPTIDLNVDLHDGY